MKILKKLIPVFVILTILLSLAVVPASASIDTEYYSARWYYIDSLPTLGFRVEGNFKLLSYEFTGSSFLFDYTSYRSYNVLSFSNGVLSATNENGTVTLSSSSGNVIDYNRFLYVESLKDTYNYDNQNVFFEWLDNVIPCNVFSLDSLVIPYGAGDNFIEMMNYIPNFSSVPPNRFVAFRPSFDRGYSLIYFEGSAVDEDTEPFEYDYHFSLSGASNSSVLSGFGIVSSWITSAFGSLDGIFFYQGSITPLGIFCLIGLAIAFAFLIFNIVKNFLKLRS